MQQKLINIILAAGDAIIQIYNTEDFGIELKADNSPLTKADKAAHNIILEGLKQFDYPILSEEGAKIPFEERKTWKRFWMVDPLDGTKEFIKKNGEFTVNIALIENGIPILGLVYAPVLGHLYYGAQYKGAFKRIYNTKTNSPLEKGGAPASAQVGGLSEYIQHQIKTVKPKDKLTVVASRSHLNEETKAYVEEVGKNFKEIEFISKGSSLKLCLLAEGSAHLYPRYAPTMEWDTAAGHAVVSAAGGRVKQTNGKEVVYNKKNLLNPWFIVEG